MITKVDTLECFDLLFQFLATVVYWTVFRIIAGTVSSELLGF